MPQVIDVQQTTFLVRDALELYAKYQSGGLGAQTTPFGRLEAEAQSYMASIQDIADSVARWRRIWTYNNIDQVLADPNAELPTTISRERWLGLKAVLLAFEQFLETDIEIAPGVTVKPIAAISQPL